MAYLLLFSLLMNILDLIIIYLSCGSPFGVYHFIYKKHNNRTAWLESLLVVLFWIPFAIYLLHTKITNKLNNENNLNNLEEISSIQKEFEDYLPTNNYQISLFELREVLERYKELTLVSSKMNGQPAKHEFEFFKINGTKNLEVPALCLHRRNHKKLLYHQNQARKDFLKTIEFLLEKNAGNKKLGKISLGFAKILNDENAYLTLTKILDNLSQTLAKSNVKVREKDLWKRQEQSKEKEIAIPLQTVTVTPSVHKKD